MKQSDRYGIARACMATLAPLLMGATQSAAVSYEMTPVFERGNLTAVDVTMHLVADDDGETIINLPDRFGGVSEHWKYLSSLAVEGARATGSGPARWILHSTAKSSITIRYRVHSAYSKEPDSNDGNLYAGAVVRPNWFEALGEHVFALPEGDTRRPATLSWSGWPKDWKLVTTAVGPGLTIEDVEGSSLLAGKSVKLLNRPIFNGSLTSAAYGDFPWDNELFADRLARIVSAQRKFWRGGQGPYTVSLVRLMPAPGVSSSGGTARQRGFVQYATPDTSLDSLSRTIAHEHTHNWIPARLGEVPEGAEDKMFWLREGFTDFYTARTLVAARIWTGREYVDDLNRTLGAIAASPSKNAPNRAIDEGFWDDPDLEQLAYNRGHLFALLIDGLLRNKAKRGLDEIMFEMERRWLSAPEGAKPTLGASFLRSLDRAGLNGPSLIERYISKGQDILLPPDLFGKCATVRTVTVPSFDLGFDGEGSFKAGHFVGVDRKGPAFAAGLRDGMERIARLAGQPGDSRFPIAFQVKDKGQIKVVQWFPRGAGHISLQEVGLARNLTPKEVQDCFAPGAK